MNTKKTTTVLRGLALAGCFMIVQQATAQSSWDTNATGVNHGIYVINTDDSNYWCKLRLQAGTTNAWNINNQGDLWWGYATNTTDTDNGTEKMRLTSGGNLGIGTSSPSQKLEVAGVTSSQGLRIPGRYTFGQSESGIEIEVPSGSYNAIRAYDGSEGIGTIHFFDDTWQSGAAGKSAGGINISSDVATTIGPWSSPVAYFRSSDGNVGIGTTDPQNKLDINGLLTVRNDGDNSTIKLQAANSKSASIGVQDDDDTGFYILTNGTYRLNVNQNGNVGIGTTIPTEKLEVDGNIKASGNIEATDVNADSVTLNIGSFPDYVFEKDYPLMPLNEVEQYIKANKHLPGFPSEAEVVKNGANLGQINNLLVEKVEELTLHTIAQEKLLNTQEKQINMLLEELNTLKAEVKTLKKQ